MDEQEVGRDLKIPQSCADVPTYELTQEYIDRYLAGSQASGELVRTITASNGKQAGLVMFRSSNTSEDVPGHTTPIVVCSCHFHGQVLETDPHVSCVWMDDCLAKRELQNSLLGFTQYHYTTPEWETKDPKEKVMDIFARITAGEYLGQSQGDMVYVHEVSNFLGVSNAEVFNACQELFAEEKLDLNGMILAKYHQRFRFPKEIQSLLAYVIEEPCGWPNGDAGQIFVHLLEQAINDHTHLKSGKITFGEENFPHLAPHHLVSFGMSWLARGIEGLRKDQFERDNIDLSALSIMLQGFVRDAEKLSALQKNDIEE